MSHDCWIDRLHRRLARLECWLVAHRVDLGLVSYGPLGQPCLTCGKTITAVRVREIIDEIASDVEDRPPRHLNPEQLRATTRSLLDLADRIVRRG